MKIELDESEFWNLIEDCKPASEEFLFGDEHFVAYNERLSSLSDEQLIAFARTRQRMKLRSYDWNLWYAACALNRFCSDDSFTNFRAALIMTGRAAFERCISEPDCGLSQLSYATRLETFERFDYVDFENYEKRSSVQETLYDHISDLKEGEPTGTQIEFDSPNGYCDFLQTKYPEICRRFGLTRSVDGL